MEPINPIIAALDTNDPEQARRWIDQLSGYVGLFKVGMELFDTMLVQLLECDAGEVEDLLYTCKGLLADLDGVCMLDLKVYDIGDTVERVIRLLARLKAWGITVPALAGMKAVQSAVANRGNSIIIGVTVLTDIDDEESNHLFGDPAGKQVLTLARDLVINGAEALVCAPAELELLKEINLVKICPNIRPEWAPLHGQEKTRSMRPREAMDAGADYLVIGRPITRPPTEIGSPAEAAKRILAEIGLR